MKNEFIKNIKIKIMGLIAMCRAINPGGREISLAITEAQRSYNWLGRYQIKIGDERTFDNPTIDFKEFFAITDRALILAHVRNTGELILDSLKEFIDTGGSAETELFIAITAITDSIMWLECAGLAISPANSTAKAKEPEQPVAAEVKEQPAEAESQPDGPSLPHGNSMTFYEALKACIVDKKLISRHNWNIGLTHVYAHQFIVNSTTTPFLMRKLPNGGSIPWQPDQLDMFAKDWIVLF